MERRAERSGFDKLNQPGFDKLNQPGFDKLNQPGFDKLNQPSATRSASRVPARALVPEALADHGRDPVGAHGDAVKGVGDLHRALLVGDHQ